MLFVRIFRNSRNFLLNVSKFSSKKWHFNECDISEKFVLGWGPGGQKINKTANCVFLTHTPTGISVKCQDSRDLHRNRDIARSRLNDKLDIHLHGEDSEVVKHQNKIKDRERKKYNRSKERLVLKKIFKDREGCN